MGMLMKPGAARAWIYNGVVALAVVLFLFWALSPPQVLVTMPPPQRVRTTNPTVGVHTRLTDEVEAWKIQRTLAMVREMGAPWIVEYFPWAYIEPESGTYRWDHSDLVIEHARNQGLTVIARLGMVPSWARPAPEEQETTFTYLEPAHYPDFARFVGDFVARYRGRARHVIIWNEPNLSLSGGIGTSIRRATPSSCVPRMGPRTKRILTLSCWVGHWHRRWSPPAARLV